MPCERNTRTIVEVPEVFVCGLLQASERPTLAGSAAFSRSMLSNSSRLSSGARPGPPRNGLIWACDAADRRTKAASAADKQRDDRRRIDFSSSLSRAHSSVRRFRRLAQRPGDRTQIGTISALACFFSVPPGPNKPITALLDLAVHGI